MKMRNLLLAGVLGALLPACGSNGTGPDDDTQVLPPQNFSMGVGQAQFADVDVFETVDFEAQADWGSASNDLDIYITSTSCVNVNAQQLLAGVCAVFARAVSTNTKPERAVFTANTGRYRVWVANFGPGSESGTLRVTLRRR